MLHSTFPQILSDIMSTWEMISPRWLLCKEKISYHFSIDEPLWLACDFEWREFPWKYLAAEMIWYLSWDLSTFNIRKYAALWWRISDSDNQVNSNYWHIVLHKKLWTWLTQYDTVLESLKLDHETRQALIRYNAHEHAYPWNKDFPCTISNQFFIRNWKLDIVVNMRSNDMFFGFQFDVVWFWLLLQSVAKDIWVEPWKIYWHTGSAHIYDKMFEKANAIIAWWNIKWYLLVLNSSFRNTRNYILANPWDYWKKLDECQNDEDIKNFISNSLWITII